jgi:superfamily II DNA/RNA helicase
MTPPDGQRMLFSATLDAAVDVLARRFMNRPAHHDIGLAEAPAAMTHHLLTIAPADRVGVVAALAGGSGRSLVFARTRHAARRLAHQLTAGGIPAAELHGDLTQGARDRNLGSFATGVVRVIVATNIAARGIHVDGIDLVIHADPPDEHKAYLHRSGRTARAGAAGTVIILQAQGQAADVRALMRKAGVAPRAATVTPSSALLRSIAGEPVALVKLPAARPAAIVATPAAGRGAAAMSAGFRGRRRR